MTNITPVQAAAARLREAVAAYRQISKEAETHRLVKPNEEWAEKWCAAGDELERAYEQYRVAAFDDE
jgi:hypothetical protein